MFTKIAIRHELVGTDQMYMPQGCSPYAIDPEPDPMEGRLVLCNGDRISVESAWRLNQNSTTLFYVRSHRTGIATHIAEADIKPLPSTWRRPTPLERATRNRPVILDELFPETPVRPAVAAALDRIIEDRA